MAESVARTGKYDFLAAARYPGAIAIPLER
jgi:hypothetical protein